MADATDPFVYNGPLALIDESGVEFDGEWALDINLEDGAYTEGDLCIVDLVYTSWYGLGTEGEGYDDEERVTLTFTAPAPAIELLESFSFQSFLSMPSEESETDYGAEQPAPSAGEEEDQNGVVEEQDSGEAIESVSEPPESGEEDEETVPSQGDEEVPQGVPDGSTEPEIEDTELDLPTDGDSAPEPE